MPLTLKTITMIVMAVVMSCFPAQAGSINMLEDDKLDTDIPDTVNFAVEIEPYYYTVTIIDGIVQKIERDGPEEPEFTVKTDFNTAVELVQNYNEMTWLEKVQFLVVRMNVPYDFIFKMAQSGIA